MGAARDARRDGFDLYKTDLDLPVHTASLDVESKRDLTICHLFINQQLTISDIACALNTDRRHVILTLLENGILKERRQGSRAPDGN